MNDYQHLLAMVQGQPDDDLVRLVMADWLEEFQDPVWADYIRQAIDLEHMEACIRPRNCGKWAPECSACMARQGMEFDLEQCLEANRSRWEAPFWPPIPLDLGHYLVWRRGFVREVRCDCTIWSDWGNRVRAAMPVEVVELNWHGDREWLKNTLDAAPVAGLELSLPMTNISLRSQTAIQYLAPHMTTLKCLRVTLAYGDGSAMFRELFPHVELKVEQEMVDTHLLEDEPPF